MKIYGFTIIDTDDNGIDGCSGKQSETYLFETAEERDKEGYEMYSEKYLDDAENDCIDESICDLKPPTKADFLLRMSNCNYDYYVRYDSSYQIEFFETEL